MATKSLQATVDNEEPEERVSETAPPESVDDDEYAIDPPDDDDDSGGDDPDPERDEEPRAGRRETPAATQSRQQKKRERGNIRKENETLRAELAAERLANAERFGRLEGAMQHRPQAPGTQQPAPEDPDERRIKELDDYMEALDTAYSAAPDSPNVATMRENFKKAQNERHRLMVRREVRSSQPQRPAQPARSESDMVIMANYPEMFETKNKTALDWSIKRYEQLVLEGHPKGMATVGLAINAAKAQYRIGMPSRQPTQADRNRHAGIPRSGGPGATDTAITYKMTDKDKARAAARFSHISDAKKREKMYFEKTIRPVLLEKRKTATAK